MIQIRVPSEDKPPLVLRPFLSRRARLVTVVALLAAALVAVGYWYWYDNQSVVDHKLVDEAKFTVYAPKHPPAGYETDTDRASLSGGVLSYGFTDETSDKDVTVTVQAKPQGFDMTQLTKGGSVSSTSVTAGVLYNLSVGGSTQYLLDTGDSLIYITSSKAIDHVWVSEFANSLSKANR